MLSSLRSCYVVLLRRPVAQRISRPFEQQVLNTVSTEDRHWLLSGPSTILQTILFNDTVSCHYPIHVLIFRMVTYIHILCEKLIRMLHDPPRLLFLHMVVLVLGIIKVETLFASLVSFSLRWFVEVRPSRTCLASPGPLL
jgi:hypothetical protein